MAEFMGGIDPETRSALLAHMMGGGQPAAPAATGHPGFGAGMSGILGAYLMARRAMQRPQQPPAPISTAPMSGPPPMAPQQVGPGLPGPQPMQQGAPMMPTPQPMIHPVTGQPMVHPGLAAQPAGGPRYFA